MHLSRSTRQTATGSLQLPSLAEYFGTVDHSSIATSSMQALAA